MSYLSKRLTSLQATYNNGQILAMSGPRNPYPGKLGAIEEGALADLLLLVDGDPLKNIKLTHQMEPKFKREVAIMGILVASAICLYVALLGGEMLANYQISLDALRIAGGLVLLISALNAIFPKVQPATPIASQPTALQLAISPVATPIIVPPVGVAAILIFVMLVPQYPGMEIAIAKALSLMLVLDFLVMFFIDKILKIPGLILVLQVLGAVLVFVQVALAIETILDAFGSLGVFKG